MRKLFLMAALGLSTSLAQAAGDPAAGEEKAAPCAACHGANGISQSPAFPNLAGQHATYLVHALEQYQSGGRNNPIMAGQVQSLSDQDIEDLAAFYSQQVGLYTPKYDHKP